MSNVYTPASPEARGAAEQLLDLLLANSGHLHHGRPGYTPPAGGWQPCILKRREDGRGDVMTPKRQPVGVYIPETGEIVAAHGGHVGRYVPPGLFPEAVAKVYRRVVEVANMDAELVARLGCWSWAQEHRDLKVVLAAWLLVQPRVGAPVMEHGKRIFDDVDYREAGVAMMLWPRADKRHFDARMLLRVREVLQLPAVVEINRAQGLGTGKHPLLGRWPDAVRAYLRGHERSPKRLAAAVRAGFRTAFIDLAKAVGYRPESPAFFQALRWRQQQSPDGHRTIGLGQAVAEAESWQGLNEAAICARIYEGRLPWKRVVSLVPAGGVTSAMVVACLEAGGISNRELILMTPLLEDLQLVGAGGPTSNPVAARWAEALAQADDQRARNIAKHARTDDTKNKLEAAADAAITKAVEPLMADLHLRVIVDISGSMSGSIPAAVDWTTRFLAGIPLERMEVATFNNWGTKRTIRHPSRAGVEQAFRGVAAGGGTAHASGLAVLSVPPRDAQWILVVIGDQEESGSLRPFFAGPNPWPAPVAVAYVEVRHSGERFVERTAAELGVPLVRLTEEQFADATDPYQMARLWPRLLAAAPAQRGPTAPVRVSLIDQVLATPLMERPAWARG